jgi:predicted PurR-regulated permease PerM
VVAKLESLNLKRSLAILVVVLGLLGAITALVWAIFPPLASEGAKFIASAPSVIKGFGELPLIIKLDAQLGGAISSAITSTSDFLSNSANWPKLVGAGWRKHLQRFLRRISHPHSEPLFHGFSKPIQGIPIRVGARIEAR